MAGDGGHIDDPSISLGLHDPHGPLGKEERTGDVDAVRQVPVLQGHLVKGNLIGDAGVVHQDIQSAEFLIQHLEAMVHIRLFGHVALDRHALALRILGHDLLGHLLGVVHIQVHNEDALGTFLGELPAVAGTHTGAAAGHQGNLALYQLLHCNFQLLF